MPKTYASWKALTSEVFKFLSTVFSDFASKNVPPSHEDRLVNHRHLCNKVCKAKKLVVIELGEYQFSFHDGDSQKLHDMDSLTELFPMFYVACKEWAIKLGHDTMCLITCAIWSLPMKETNSKRHQVYKHMAWALGWSERQPFPAPIIEVVRAT